MFLQDYTYYFIVQKYTKETQGRINIKCGKRKRQRTCNRHILPRVYLYIKYISSGILQAYFSVLRRINTISFEGRYFNEMKRWNIQIISIAYLMIIAMDKTEKDQAKIFLLNSKLDNYIFSASKVNNIFMILLHKSLSSAPLNCNHMHRNCIMHLMTNFAELV